MTDGISISCKVSVDSSAVEGAWEVSVDSSAVEGAWEVLAYLGAHHEFTENEIAAITSAMESSIVVADDHSTVVVDPREAVRLARFYAFR